jgi:Transglutaminase-like superfamily
MRIIRNLATLILPVCLLLFPAAASAGPVLQLATPPLGERWYSISMGGERVGFAHTSISAAPGGYEIFSDGSVKMRVFGFSREAASRETYLVGNDLSLRSFEVKETIDGSLMSIKGEVTPQGVSVAIEAAGKTRKKLLKARGKVYPPPALNLCPLIQGVVTGKEYRLQMMDVEGIRIKEVTVTALGPEKLPGGVATIHLRNDLYQVDNDVWVDLDGNTLKESVRDGLIVTSAEDGSVTRQFILDAALAKRDLVLDFSLVRTDRPIDKPSGVRKAAVELSGFSDAVPVISDGRQVGVRFGGGRVLFVVDASPGAFGKEKVAADAPENRKYLEPDDRILSDASETKAEAEKILAGEKDPLAKVRLLTRWVADTVKESVTDSQTSLEILRKRKGNCQAHARLYTSLARAAGVPTRFVSGLVYVEGKGFLYHSWAESYAGKWLAVDPTFGQVPADGTHIKLVEGDSPGDMAPIAGLIGRLAAKVVDVQY